MSVRIITLLGFTGSESAEGISRNRELILTGESDESRIFTVSDATNGYSVPTIGTAHPTFTGLTLRARDPQRLTADQWKIVLRYEGKELQTGGTSTTSEIRYRWEFGQRSENRDYDVYNKPLVDRAGFPIADKFPFTYRTLFLKIWRPENDFDVPTAFQICQRVNSKRMYIFNRWWIDPGQMMLWTYSPESDQTLGSTKTTNLYVFEFRSGLRPFQPKWRNAGFNGWTNEATPKIGVYCRPNGEEFSEPVQLSNNGSPLNADIRVKDATGAVKFPTSTSPAVANMPLITATTASHPPVALRTPGKTYQYAYTDWIQTNNSTYYSQLLSQDFFEETDFRGLMPGVM